jgi:hypothetical protein
VAAGLFFSGCGGNAVLDLAPLSDFYDLRVQNDTASEVTVGPCWGSKCQHLDGIKTTLRPGAHRDMAFWGNETSGLAALQISRDGTAVGCLYLRYRKGQTHGQAQVSAASPC